LAAPDGPTVHALRGADGALQIKAPLGEVNVNFHKVTNGLAREAISNPGGRANAAKSTVWSSGELTPGNGVGKLYSAGNSNAGGIGNASANSSASSSAGANGNAGGNGNGNGIGNVVGIGNNGNGNGNGVGNGIGNGVGTTNPNANANANAHAHKP
jgi:hypothetical protein